MYYYFVNKETILKIMISNIIEIFSSLVNIFSRIELVNKDDSMILNNYSMTEMHCVENIEKINYANVTKLANVMNLTKGGVSKTIKKLIQKGVVESYSLDSNKKEIYYKLTSLGESIFDAHEKLHKNWSSKDSEFFKSFTEDELKITAKVLAKYDEYLQTQVGERK